MKKLWVNDYHKIQFRCKGEKRWYCYGRQLVYLRDAKRLAKELLADGSKWDTPIVATRVRYYHPHYIKARTVWKSY